MSDSSRNFVPLSRSPPSRRKGKGDGLYSEPIPEDTPVLGARDMFLSHLRRNSNSSSQRDNSPQEFSGPPSIVEPSGHDTFSSSPFPSPRLHITSLANGRNGYNDTRSDSQSIQSPNGSLSVDFGTTQLQESSSQRSVRAGRSGSASSNVSLGPYKELKQWESQTPTEQFLIDLDPSRHGSPDPGIWRSNETGLGNSRNSLLDEELLIEVRDVQPELDRALLHGINPTPSYLKQPSQLRSRSNSRTMPSACESCEEVHAPGQSYCNICKMLLCADCWSKQLRHRKSKPDEIHEKTNFELAMKIEQILKPTVDDIQHEKMHIQDQNTTWFGIVREGVNLPMFQDYGRFVSLMSREQFGNSTYGHDTRFPSVVSFVGQTGAGKSTLIRLLMDLNDEARQPQPMPVVGSIKNQEVPTSGDVHLYADPKTFEQVNPLLYADCEGLDGGEREPISAKFRNKNKVSDAGRASMERNATETVPYSEREITWADAANSRKRSREFAVKELYPRLLYTFSDVVVFVLKEARVIESVLQKLVDWAAAALESSSNQPVLPHAVIALNAMDYGIDADRWDTDSATRLIMKELSATVYRNSSFASYAEFWRKRNRRIETVQQLLESYYSSVRVVYIPTVGRPNFISGQVMKLYDEISRSCDQARSKKSELRMLLDADELQPYLQYAFDHFASHLDTPFDFVKASFTHSPIPLDFGGNILKLALNIMNAWKNEVDGEAIFSELSYMVASCIMLDSARHKKIGTAEKTFKYYMNHIDAALDNFCDRHWPCEYVGRDGEKCVNVRSGHGSKGHQSKSGRLFDVGDYQSRFQFATHANWLRFKVYSTLDYLLRLLQKRVKEVADDSSDAPSEGKIAAKIHKDKVMADFYLHAARKEPRKFISHSTCFSCLFEPPIHALPCGHIICTACLKDYGCSYNKLEVEIGGCPLEISTRPIQQTWKVYLKPPTAGIRVLILDGGGIRGIAELEILRQIEAAMGGIPIRHFFDLIVGTSTGGIVALGIGAKLWSVEQATRHFTTLCRQSFTPRLGSRTSVVKHLVNNFHHSKYETKPLEEALITAFSEEQYLFGGVHRGQPSDSNIKLAVTATSTTGRTVLLSNYNRSSPVREKLWYMFQRPEVPDAELKLWEAARATSAAPTYFKPMCHGPSKQVYTDGGLYHNNPIRVADAEWKLLWPLIKQPDIMLSLGTCHNPSADSRNIKKSLKTPTNRVGVLSNLRSLIKIAHDHVTASLDSERAWNEYMSILSPSDIDKKRYVRLNARLDRDPPQLDEVDKMFDLEENVRDCMHLDDRIEDVAMQLLATSFYFDVAGIREDATSGNFECNGRVLCRLLPSSDEMYALGHVLTDFAATHPLSFTISEQGSPASRRIEMLPADVLEKIVKTGKFIGQRLKIELSHKLAVADIALSLKQNQKAYSISQFPRALNKSTDDSHYLKLSKTSSSSRWSNRTIAHVEDWVAPSLNVVEESGRNPFLRYSEPGYVLGDASGPSAASKSEMGTGLPQVPMIPEAAGHEVFEMEDNSCLR